MKLPTEKKERSIDLKMTPMIDVVFLLLVFFVWTSSFDLPEFDLPSSLAQPPNGGVEAQTPMTPVEEFDEILFVSVRASIKCYIRRIGFSPFNFPVLCTPVSMNIYCWQPIARRWTKLHFYWSWQGESERIPTGDDGRTNHTELTFCR